MAVFGAPGERAWRLDYTNETRNLDGVTCTIDVYPASGYEAEAAFYFDEEGDLVRLVEGPPVIDVGVEIGESVYSIESIDTAVDESLFEITGYHITE